MRILIFHGYLLGGTGSNVYNARLAAALVRAGHEVHLLCQDARPVRSRSGSTPPATGTPARWRSTTRREPVRATVYRPDLGGLLPVYVADRYEGVEAKPFPELTDAELDALPRAQRRRRARGRRARRARRRARQPPRDGPASCSRGRSTASRTRSRSTARRSSTPSSRTPALPPVRPRGARARARAVLVGSRHTAESLWAAMDDPGLEARTQARPAGRRHRRVRAAGARRGAARAARRSCGACASTEAVEDASSFARDPAARPPRRSPRSGPEDRLVVFVGKLIASKGVDLLLAAWPLVVERVPDAKLVIVGFGAFREGLERLAADLAAGDLDAARAHARGERAGAEVPRAPSSTARRDGYGARRSTASCGPAGSTTPSSPTCCPPPRRWSSRARSPRRSGWSPPRRPPAARCPSWRATAGSARSRRRCRRPSRRRRGRCSPSSAAPARCRSWRPPWPAGSRRPRTCARPPATRWWRSRASATRGTVSRAPSWTPREGRLDGLPAP